MFSDEPFFKNRVEAGKRLARELSRYGREHPLILGLPRGGVPVAHEIASALGADLDVLFVRKLRAPGYEELGIGAVVDGADPQIVLNDDMIRQLAVGNDYIHTEVAHQLKEIERRRHFYQGKRKPIEIKGRTVILVDDGIATGGTVRSAIKGLRKAHAGKIILAVPVAAASALHALANECDDIVCLYAPHNFYAVGVHYGDFSQTSDDEVVRLLSEAGDPQRTRAEHAN